MLRMTKAGELLVIHIYGDARLVSYVSDSQYSESDRKAILLEKTLIIVKPDAVQRGLTGAIITRFEARGLKIIGLKLMQVDRAN